MSVSDYYDDGGVHVSKEELNTLPHSARHAYPRGAYLRCCHLCVRCKIRWEDDSVW